MGDSGTKTTTTSTSSEIPAEAKPLATALAQLGMTNLTNYTTQDTTYSDTYKDALSKMASGYYLDPATNASLQKQEAAVDVDAQEQYNRAIGENQSAAAKAGALLGVKSRAAAAQAGRQVANDASKTKAALEASNYNTERGNQNTALEKQYALYRQPLSDALTALSILRGTSGTSSTESVQDSGGNWLSNLF